MFEMVFSPTYRLDCLQPVLEMANYKSCGICMPLFVSEFLHCVNNYSQLIFLPLMSRYIRISCFDFKSTRNLKIMVIFKALLVEEKEQSLESGVSVSKATFKALVSSSSSLFVSKQNIYKV